MTGAELAERLREQVAGVTLGVVGPGRCALTGQGPLEPRIERLLTRLRRDPLPAPTADPPGALSDGDLQGALFS